MARRCSDEEMLTGILQHRIERWLELEGVFTLSSSPAEPIVNDSQYRHHAHVERTRTHEALAHSAFHVLQIS